MFRIDRTSVEYQQDAPPFVVTVPKRAEHAQRDSGTGAPLDSGAEPVGEVERKRLQHEASLERLRNEIEQDARRKAGEISEGILVTAREKAEKIISAAQDEANALKKAAYEKALEDGEAEVERRIERTQSEARKEISGIIARLDEQMGASLDEIIGGWEEGLIDLALDIARKIINVELDRNDQAFRMLVQNALSHMRGDVKMTVNVSPGEFERYFSQGDAVFRIGSETIKTTVNEDPLLERGGCVVESEGEMINAGIEQQLKAMGEALKRNGARQDIEGLAAGEVSGLSQQAQTDRQAQ